MGLVYYEANLDVSFVIIKCSVLFYNEMTVLNCETISFVNETVAPLFYY